MEREVLRGSLSELEVDRIQGRLNAKDYERLKATDERSLLRVLDRLAQTQVGEATPAKAQKIKKSSLPKPEPTRVKALHRAYALIVALLVVIGSVGTYRYIQWAENEKIIARAEQGQAMPDPREMVARLEARLKENPNDLQGQIMAGRSYMTLGRIDEARKAWEKVLELDAGSNEGHFHIGVLLVETPTDNKNVFEQALKHFDTVLVDLPKEPTTLWYKGLALVQLNRFMEADQSWTTAYQNLDPESEDAEVVKQALQSLRAGNFPQF